MIRLDVIFIPIDTKDISHNYRHTENRPFKCSHSGCDKSYTDKYDLKIHVIHSHNLVKNIPFPTDGCIKKFKTNTHLKYHMKCHTNIKPFTCD